MESLVDTGFLAKSKIGPDFSKELVIRIEKNIRKVSKISLINQIYSKLIDFLIFPITQYKF